MSKKYKEPSDEVIKVKNEKKYIKLNIFQEFERIVEGVRRAIEANLHNRAADERDKLSLLIYANYRRYGIYDNTLINRRELDLIYKMYERDNNIYPRIPFTKQVR